MIYKALAYIKRFLCRYSIVALLFFLLAGISIYASLGASYARLERFNVFYVFWGCVNALIILSMLCLISRTNKFKVLLIIILALLLTIDLTHLFAFGARITFGGIASMFETNAKEASSMLGILLPYAIPIFILLFLLFLKASKELSNCKWNSWSFVLCLFFSAIILPSMLVARSIMEWDQRLYILKENPLFMIQDRTSRKLPLLYGTLVTMCAYWDESIQFNKFVNIPRVLPEGVSFDKKRDRPQTVYVVIGESSVRSHYSIYGYSIPTTPWLDSMKLSNELYLIDAFSPASITRDAIKMSLSFAVPNNLKLFFENSNAVELGRLAGYKTYWISNQDKLGPMDSANGLIASCADYLEFHDYTKDDLELIDIVDRLYNKKEYQIFFIHLKGSHLPYDDKSDEADKRIDKYYQNTDQKTLIYDRSISHVDRVINNLYQNTINHQDSISSLIYYYSDHGEVVNHGHGYDGGGVDQYLIPFVSIPVNNQFDVKKIISPYLNDNGFNSVNFINVFAESIGYSISEERIQQSKNEGLSIYHVDRKVYKFSDIKK